MTAVNSIPRIALAPIIILAFGIGDASKIATSWIVVVFLVFFNTFEGARLVDRDYINASRLLGTSEWSCHGLPQQVVRACPEGAVPLSR